MPDLTVAGQFNCKISAHIKAHKIKQRTVCAGVVLRMDALPRQPRMIGIDLCASVRIETHKSPVLLAL